MEDLRFRCTDRYKKQIKKEAIDKGVSVSQLLAGIVMDAIPPSDDFIDFDEVKKELNDVRNRLIYQSSQMDRDERIRLKQRKDELKELLKKEGK